MATSETRSIAQCVYTPVVHGTVAGDGGAPFVAKQPFLKLALLKTIFDEPDLHQILLDPRRGGGEAQVATAIDHAWKGDVGTAVDILRRMDTKVVLDVAGRALDAHETMIHSAVKDLDAAIETLGTAATPPSRRIGALDATRVPAPAPGAPATTAGGAGDRVLDARFTEAPAAPDAEVAPVTRDALQARLGRVAPRTATFLSHARFFALPEATTLATRESVRELVAFGAAQLAELQRKREALRAVSFHGLTEPVGLLHLERLQFTPIGYERGDLVYSLPMLPGETVRLSHREWTRTQTDFAQLVATSRETATQDALSEKSELTESVAAQQQHTSAFNTSTTASGGFGPVQISETVGFNTQNAETSSRQTSAKHAQEVTRAASSRAKEEHKVSFRVTTEYDVEDSSFREVRNTTDRAVRYDYYRLMKKWQIDLYRYDLRLTYDLIVPEPGSYILRRHVLLLRLEEAIARAFQLDLTPTNITRRNWQALAARFGAALEAPPEEYIEVQGYAQQTYSQRVVGADFVQLNLPDGYKFDKVLSAEGSRIGTDEHPSRSVGKILVERHYNQTVLAAGDGRTTTFAWRYTYDWSEAVEPEKGDVLAISVALRGVLTARAFAGWQMASYARILDAAKARFEERRQRLVARRDQLKADLERDDGLALRKLEKEEIMKGVLRWVLGSNFYFYPSDLPDLTLSTRDLEEYDPTTERVDDEEVKAMARYGQEIRFLQHAIEWENTNYVLYPYFWTDTSRWSFKQALFHPDVEHRAFLRAGAARVVLTVRPGFEKAFLSFMETGKLDELSDDPDLGTYFTLADEVRAMAMTTYRYTPSANAERPENKVDTWFEFTPTGALDVAEGRVLDN